MIRGRKDANVAQTDKEKILIVADDLTGASDTVIQFGRNTLQCMVITSGNAAEAIERCDVLAIDTETRFMDAETAYRRVYTAGKKLKGKNLKLVYKKIDSTMRGNPGAEIAALMDSMHIKRAILAPALPAYGRTTQNGSVYVNNVLLENTGFSGDPMNPVKASFIPEILSAQCGKKTGLVVYTDLEKGKDNLHEKIRFLFNAGSEMIIVDAKTDNDLDLIASYVDSLNEPVIYAGCSGLASSLGKLLIQGLQNKINIVLAGSASPVTRKQLNKAAQELPVILIDVDAEKIISGSSRQEIRRIIKRVKEASLAGKDVIIRTAPDEGSVEKTFRIASYKGLDEKNACEMISAFLGRLLKHILEDISVNGLVLTGGDTAIKAVKNLGIQGIRVLGEVDEGIPFGYFDDERFSDITMVSKAGGFGHDTAIVKILGFLKEKR